MIASGLRREEAIEFTSAYSDRGDRVRIKASWAKGGCRRRPPQSAEARFRPHCTFD